MAQKRRGKLRAVVPQIVFSTVFVGVIPACVASACSSGTALTTDGGSEVGINPGVAAVAYQCFDANDPNCHQQGVAAQCFDGGQVVPCNFGGPDGASDGADDALDGSNDGADATG